MLTNIQRAVLKTLVYSDMFDYPLTTQEIYQYLLSDEPVAKSLVLKSLEVLVEKSIVDKAGRYWFLIGRESLVIRRKRCKAHSAKKFVRAYKVAECIKFIPWIRMIAVTGGLAMENADKEDDIDFLIVTSPNRLWISRIILVFLLKLFGVYRDSAGAVADKICPNLWVAASRLQFPFKNLFTAHEIAQAKPLFVRKSIYYKKFLAQNRWIAGYLPNYANDYIETCCGPPTEFRRNLLSPFFDLLDKFVFKLQLNYMASKITNEYVSKSLAAFHPENRAKTVLKMYLTRCEEII